MKIEKTEVYGVEEAFRGMRNPMNSWDKSDSQWDYFYGGFLIGNNDMELAYKLI